MRRPFSSPQRWPLVPTCGPEEHRTGLRVAAAALGVFLLGASLLSEAFLPFAARIAIAALALVPFGYAAFSGRPARKTTPAHLEADARGIFRVTGDDRTELVSWDAPFGAALLASYGRPTALLAFTTPTHTRYVPVRIEGRDEIEDELFAGVAVLADLDLMDGVAHDPALTSTAAAVVLRLAKDHRKGAFGALYLSDGRGKPIAVDRGTLTVGERSFDLTSHLEWRTLMFHESTGQAAALYQATWIRQGTSEVFLVAPMPASIVPCEPSAKQGATGRLGRALTRDLKLLQAPAETPPPHEARVAIDRPFMLAVRRSLATAPLATRMTIEAPSRSRSARRDSLV